MAVNYNALLLGKPLVLKFAREFMPDDFDEVRRIVRRRAVDRWYEFEQKAEEKSLREWCAENGIEITD